MGGAYRPGDAAGAPHGAVAQLVGAAQSVCRERSAQVVGSNPACSTSPIQAVYLWPSKKAEPIPSLVPKSGYVPAFSLLSQAGAVRMSGEADGYGGVSE